MFSDKAQLFSACQNYEFSKLLISTKNHYLQTRKDALMTHREVLEQVLDL